MNPLRFPFQNLIIYVKSHQMSDEETFKIPCQTFLNLFTHARSSITHVNILNGKLRFQKAPLTFTIDNVFLLFCFVCLHSKFHYL